MDSVLFNFHDVILLMTSLQCLFFGLLLYLSKSPNDKHTIYLVLFLICHSLSPLYEILVWGEAFTTAVSINVPILYFVTGLAYYFDALFLLLFVQNLTQTQFKIKPSYALSVIPLAVYFIYGYQAFLSLTSSEQIDAISSASYVYSQGYISVDFFNKSIRLILSIYTYWLIIKYTKGIKGQYSTIQNTSVRWLKGLLLGYIFVVSIEYILSTTKIISIFGALNSIHRTLGLIGYYVQFIFITLITYSSIRYFSDFRSINFIEHHQNKAK